MFDRELVLYDASTCMRRPSVLWIYFLNPLYVILFIFNYVDILSNLFVPTYSLDQL